MPGPDDEPPGGDGQRLIYESSNGDAWFLGLDPATQRPAVKHVANLPSGGGIAYKDIESFLRAGNGPEHQALRRLIRAERLATILIAYDIHPAEGASYQELADAIQSLGAWWHHLETAWIVRSNRAPEEIRNKLKPYIGADDQLLVVDISGDKAAWVGVNETGDSWLRENINDGTAADLLT
jgi:hypothetical protein